MDVLEKVQALIQYCPLCGYKSQKKFDDYMEDGGDWVCENCHERVEAYLLELEQDAPEDELTEESSSGGFFSVGLFAVILLVIGYIIFNF